MKLRKFLMALTIIVLTFTPISALHVSANADVQPQELLELIQELHREIYDLRRQIEEAPATTQPPAGSPNPRLTAPQNITVSAGQTIEITLTLRNIGMGVASNILSQATPSAGAPFTVEFLNNSNSINSLAANAQRDMTLRITVNPNAGTGSYQISLTHFFRTPGNENTTTTDAINVNVVGSDDGVPNVRLSNFRGGVTQIEPGQNFTINADISNLGSIDARDVQISMPNLSPDSIFFTGDLNQFFFASIAAGHTSTLSFPLRAAQNITGGTHQVDFHITSRGEPGTASISETFSAFVTVYVQDEIETQANFEIRGLIGPTNTLNVGQTGTFSFYVYNVGNAVARNIRVATNTGSSIRTTQTASIQTIHSLEPGESQRLSFSFFATNTAETGSHDIGFIVGQGDNAIEQFTVLNIYNPDADDDNQTAPGRVQIPRVIVAGLELYPALPRAGQEFSMEITFRNTSSTRSVNNIRILMEEIIGSNIPGQQSHFAGFNPVGGSSTIFLDYIEPQGEIVKTLRFTTVTEATPGAHTMRFSFDYQDQDFYTHDAQQQVSIQVAQVTNLELVDVTIGGWATPMVGMPVPFSYNIFNSGRVNLINVRTRTEGPFDVSRAGRPIGMLNAQRTAGFDGEFIPFYPGEHSGTFIVYGEDITGELVEIRHEFTIFVDGGWTEENHFEGEEWREGGGFNNMGMRPFPEGGDSWCPVAQEMVQTGYMCMETNEWISLGEWCMYTGAWLPHGNSALTLRIPIIIGAAPLIVSAIILIIRMRRKRTPFDVNLDD